MLSTEKNYSANLDLLRAVAVLLVFIAHYRRAHHDLSLTKLGNLGVILFFIHTCFVLMASLQRLEKESTSDVGLVAAFWIRRLFRIYPLAILCVAVTAVFSIPSDPGEMFSWIGWKGLIANFALMQNVANYPSILGVLWSLPLEVQMYIVLPFAYFSIRRDRDYGSFTLVLITVVMGVGVLLLGPSHPSLMYRLWVFIYAPCFTAGIVAFNLIQSEKWEWRLPSWTWPVGILLAIFWYGPIGPVMQPPRAWILSLFLGVLYANVKDARHNWINSISHWIAERSYGIYLSHSIILWIVFYRMDQFPLGMQIPTLIAGSIGIPAVLYITIERPLIRLGARLAKRILMRPSKNSISQPA